MSSYRISTAGQQSAAIAQMLQQQALIAKTQQQVSSGVRVQTPADDPVAESRILSIQNAQSQLDQYGKNADAATDRLNQGEQALADLATLLQRIQELAEQANSGAMDDTSLNSIATELKSHVSDLQQIANRQDSNGEYLFAGYSTGTQPFAGSGGGMTYVGDQGVRQLQIGASQTVADGIPGQQVFMDIPQGNGTFTVTAGSNSGTGVIGVQQVVDAAQWNAAVAANAAATPPLANQYTIRFTDPDGDGTADSWELLDANGNPVMDNGTPPAAVTGTYTDGGSISFDGIQFTLSGQPAAGDTFQVQPAGTESMFQTLNDLITALGNGNGTPQLQTQLGTALNKALSQLDNGLNNAINLRTEVGARLSSLDTASSLRDDLNAQLTTSLSNTQDVDMAQAIGQLNQQMLGLQAAQAAYTRIGQLSLFDYLR
ncbi:MAG TPA: flagellar hook-associated protein FlgL [Steroidobacteraceae bacterium]|nr:flagellar hook-associated protein FlgL [Steroidobacteraceae bacterium]